MVSIIPSDRTGLDVLGKYLGQGAQNAMPQMYENQKRQMGINAIDQLQDQLKAANGDISKMLPAIAKAYTLNPALERSGIAEKLIPLAQRNQGVKEFPAGGKTTGSMPTRPQQRQEGESQKEVPVSVSDLVPQRQSMIQNPQGTQDFQLPYGPEEIAQIRQRSRELGYTPEMEERFVNDSLEYNRIAENRRANEIQNFQQREAERKATLDNQNAFEKYMVTHDPEF